MGAVFDSRRRRLVFPSLFPGLDHATAGALRRIVESRRARHQPRHKRLDARRARITAATRNSDLSLSVEIRGDNHAYAVKNALNLVNELFVALQEGHPEYLAERFGFSTE